MQVWYDCHTTTQAGTPGRDNCYIEAFGRNFGRDAGTLRLLMRLISVRVLSACTLTSVMLEALRAPCTSYVDNV